MNDYDQAARYTAKLDPIGFLRWLAPGMDPQLVFREWMDTRSLPFPGESDRTCDTVAALADGTSQRCAFVVEFQSHPHRLMLSRLLEYLGRLNMELASSRRPFQVAAGLVNLTGRVQSSRLKMSLPGTAEASLNFQVAMKTLPAEDAAATLAAIAAGELGLCILPWIPLMRGGGKRAIIKEWKEIAGREPDSGMRTTYSGLALVFAELARRSSIWREELRRWNVRESAIINEWRDEGRVEGRVEGGVEIRRADLLELFNLRFGPVPADFAAKVNVETNLDKLGQWFRSLAQAASGEEFLRQSNGMVN